MRGIIKTSLFVSFMAVSSVAAQAQATNPLRPTTPQPSVTAPVVAASTPNAAAAPAEKAKRARSPAQLANDNRMRACGAEWRANKAALTAQGKTWRVYSTECRARLKAAGQ